MERTDHELALRTVDERTAGYGTALAFAPDGDHWVSAAPGIAHLWRQAEPGPTLSPPTTDFGRVRFSRDGSRLLIGPYVYNVSDGTWLSYAPLFDQLGPPLSAPGMFDVAGAAWDGDGEDLVVAARFRGVGGVIGARERVVVLRGANRTPIATLYEGDREIRGLAIDDRFVAVAIRDIAIWSRAEHHQVAALSGHAVTVTDLAFSPDGRWLASLDGHGVLLVWETSRWGEPVARIQTSPDRGLAVAWHPSRPLVATGGYDGVVRLWAIDGRAEPVVASAPLGGWVEGLAFAPGGGRLVAAAHADPARLVVFAVE